ncbi:hypothetical protein ACFQH9_06715 [Pseudonocardia lutea]|uniref:Uncharacterized protein n=1 Tax=Pseudonocardia lutea TaxID=2172015 RepID=A0ABW1I2X0_9PSEU
MRLRRAALALVAAAGLAGLAGCAISGPTPLCDEARGLVDQGQLAQAAELFARAQVRNEGTCAENGLGEVGERYTMAYTDAARGSAAEIEGHTDLARSAYESALRLDAGNQAASNGLVRLGLPPAERSNPLALPAVAPYPQASWWTGWQLALPALALALLAVAGVAALWRRGGIGPRDRALDDGPELDGGSRPSAFREWRGRGWRRRRSDEEAALEPGASPGDSGPAAGRPGGRDLGRGGSRWGSRRPTQKAADDRWARGQTEPSPEREPADVLPPTSRPIPAASGAAAAAGVLAAGEVAAERQEAEPTAARREAEPTDPGLGVRSKAQDGSSGREDAEPSDRGDVQVVKPSSLEQPGSGGEAGPGVAERNGVVPAAQPGSESATLPSGAAVESNEESTPTSGKAGPAEPRSAVDAEPAAPPAPAGAEEQAEPPSEGDAAPATEGEGAPSTEAPRGEGSSSDRASAATSEEEPPTAAAPRDRGEVPTDAPGPEPANPSDEELLEERAAAEAPTTPEAPSSTARTAPTSTVGTTDAPASAAGTADAPASAAGTVVAAAAVGAAAVGAAKAASRATTSTARGDEPAGGPSAGDDPAAGPAAGGDGPAGPTADTSTAPGAAAGDDTAARPTAGVDTAARPTAGADTTAEPTARDRPAGPSGDDTAPDETGGNDSAAAPATGEHVETAPTAGAGTAATSAAETASLMEPAPPAGSPDPALRAHLAGLDLEIGQLQRILNRSLRTDRDGGPPRFFAARRPVKGPAVAVTLEIVSLQLAGGEHTGSTVCVRRTVAAERQPGPWVPEDRENRWQDVAEEVDHRPFGSIRDSDNRMWITPGREELREILRDLNRIRPVWLPLLGGDSPGAALPLAPPPADQVTGLRAAFDGAQPLVSPQPLPSGVRLLAIVDALLAGHDLVNVRVDAVANEVLALAAAESVEHELDRHLLPLGR